MMRPIITGVELTNLLEYFLLGVGLGIGALALLKASDQPQLAKVMKITVGDVVGFAGALIGFGSICVLAGWLVIAGIGLLAALIEGIGRLLGV